MEPLDSPLVHVFARNLKRLRTKARLSQEELALRAGLDRTYISGCERAVRNPSLLSVEKIAAALNETASDLLEATSDI
jgi:transcriptional regulator with XRE-family HTH domain